MWEWSKSLLKKNKKRAPLQSSFSDLFPATSPQHKEETILSPEEMLEYLLIKIKKLNLKNIELRECAFFPQTWGEMTKNTTQYQRMRKTFLKLIGYSHQEECKKIGFDEEDMELLKNKKSPENYNVHIKIPLEFGGKLEISNLSLIITHPLHDNIHSLIEEQISCGFLQKYKFVYIPWFSGSFYYD